MIGSIANERMANGVVRTPATHQAGARFSEAFRSATAEETRSTTAFTTRHAAKIDSEDDPESARLKEAVATFKKELSLTPAERIRRDVLKSMDLTEEAVEALPPEEKVKVEEKVAMEVARRMKIMTGTAPGLAPLTPSIA